MDLAEEYFKHCIKAALDNNLKDLISLDKSLPDFLEKIHKEPIPRITYDEAIKIMLEANNKNRKKPLFKHKVCWGIHLDKEHEEYLSKHLNGPVFIYNFPKLIKAFYMRENDDEETVSAFDLIVPRVGEIIGGSQREERYNKLLQTITDMKLNLENYQWYLDLRKYGTVPHSGFGLGFDRLIMFLTNTDNIKDAIPYPRFKQHCEF